MKSPDNKRILGFRQFLVDELQKRQKRNSSYSMNAFARDIGLTSSRLSEILNSKVGMSEARAKQIAERLLLPESEKNYFIDLVQSEHGRSSMAKKAAQARLHERFVGARKIEREEFFLISDWHNLALLELLNVKGVRHSVEEFARRLGLQEEVVRQTLERLLRLGYIVEEGARWVPSEPDTTTDADIPSKAIQKYHQQILGKAQEALQMDAVEDRDFSSLIFAMNKKQIAYAKDRIRSFRRSLVKELEEMTDKDSVYCLALQFFSVVEKK